MRKIRNVLIKTLSVLSACCLTLGSCAESFTFNPQQEVNNGVSNVKKTNYSVNTKIEDY